MSKAKLPGGMKFKGCDAKQLGSMSRACLMPPPNAPQIGHSMEANLIQFELLLKLHLVPALISKQEEHLAERSTINLPTVQSNRL